MSAMSLADSGVRYSVTLESRNDFSRQLVRSSHATVKILCVDLEMPPGKQGAVTTIEGLFTEAIDNLSGSLSVVDSETASKILGIIQSLTQCIMGEKFPVEIRIDDPSGNSYVESYCAPDPDPQIVISYYERTKDQIHAMGYFETQNEDREFRSSDNSINNAGSIPVECYVCGQMGSQNICCIDIPGFRECLVMAFVCEHCGIKTNEIKPGGPIGSKGRRWKLYVDSPEDLNRDVLKSDAAGLEIPEIDLVLEPGTLGGVFTTIEGILTKISNEIAQNFPFLGDGAEQNRAEKIRALILSLEEVSKTERARAIVRWPLENDFPSQ